MTLFCIFQFIEPILGLVMEISVFIAVTVLQNLLHLSVRFHFYCKLELKAQILREISGYIFIKWKKNLVRCMLRISTITYVVFEVLTAVVMKSTNFWDITPCSPLSVNRRFGGTYRLHLQARKNKLSKKPSGNRTPAIQPIACHYTY
jgi:hypothetical protein